VGSHWEAVVLLQHALQAALAPVRCSVVAPCNLLEHAQMPVSGRNAVDTVYYQSSCTLQLNSTGSA
jgi:hypothetical protein